MLSDEQMSKRWPFSLLNDEQMSNWVGVKHLPDCFKMCVVFVSILRQAPAKEAKEKYQEAWHLDSLLDAAVWFWMVV